MNGLFESKADLIKKYFSTAINIGAEGYMPAWDHVGTLEARITYLAIYQGLPTFAGWQYSDQTIERVCDDETYHKLRKQAHKQVHDEYKNHVLSLVRDNLVQWSFAAHTMGTTLIHGGKGDKLEGEAIDEIIAIISRRFDK